MSVIDLLTALYFHVLIGEPRRSVGPGRDRLVLSKGHTALALYIVLAEKGFIPMDGDRDLPQTHSRLNGHPNRLKVPGVETNTGPLGHGLPVGVGMAKAAQLDGASWRTFVITGDGEMQEGSNWEAIMAAAQFRLDNLTLVIDHNRLQQGARLAETNDLAPFAPKARPSAGRSRRSTATTWNRSAGALSRGRGAPAGRNAWSRIRTRGTASRSCPTTWRGITRCRTRNSTATGDGRTGGGRRMNAPLRDAKLHDCRDAFVGVLEALGAENPDVVAVCNDSVGSSKLGGFRDRFPERLINVGIAEQNMVGVGRGLANGGKLPFVCAASPFLTGRALEQIKADVAYTSPT
jgi:transketolase